MSHVEKVKHLASGTILKDSRGESDTVKLWENYREQAAMWRAIALFQMPTSCLLVIFSIVLWVGRSTTLNVPAKPLPGIYLAKEIPDTEFIEFATTFVNLIATYQPAVGRRQYNQAREMIKEPMLTRFNQEMMDIELKAIETTYRTQAFFIDPVKTTVTRLNEKEITVTFEGERQKIVAGKELPTTQSRYSITMTTLPRQSVNPYGIVITNAIYEQVKQ
jgi:predicted nucleic-acid-binding protein